MPRSAAPALALALLALLAPRAAAAATPPPPGCSADESQPLRWICYGMELLLRPCNVTDSRQHFWTASGGGNLRHYYGAGAANPGPGEAVTSWAGSDYGWRPALSLQPLVPGLPAQSWWETARDTTDDTIISNVQNSSAGNITAILGCRQWEVVGAPALADGARVVPVACSDIGTAGRSFSFDGSPDLMGLIAALSSPTNATSFSGLCVAVDTAEPASIGAYNVIDDGAGDNFAQVHDGVGAQFGKGSARLLMDYEDEWRQEILDFLFTPGAGAGLNIALLEIGGDGQSVDGATPSHQHTAAEAPKVMRGTQGWLAQQARLRNPAIKLFWLPYSFPSWLGEAPAQGGAGSAGGGAGGAGVTNASAGLGASPFADPARTAAYVVSYLAGLQAAYGGSGANMTADAVGVWSDAAFDEAVMVPYVISLRAALNAAGMQGTRIVCADETSGWGCAAAAMKPGRSLFSQAVGIFSGHGVPAADSAPFQTNRPLWRTYVDSNGFISDLVGASVAAFTTQQAALGGLNAVVHWGALSSVPDGHPEYGNGLIRADSPWSGHYYVSPKLWAIAHTTAFADPGWHVLKAGFGSGSLALGGTYVTRAEWETGSEFSVVINKLEGGNAAQNAAFQSETVTFTLRGRLLSAVQARGSFLYVFRSNFGMSASGNVSLLQNAGVTTLYQPAGAGVGDYVFSVFVGTNTVTTVTIDNSFAKLQTTPLAPRALPTDLAVDWTATDGSVGAPPQTPPYLIAVNGAFELVDDPAAGRGLQQTAAGVPITRFGTDTVPHATFGDEAWTDVDATARVWLPSAADGALLGVRCSGVGASLNEHVSGMDALPGVWLTANLTYWALTDRLDKAAKLIATGFFEPVLAAQAWHSMRLVARGNRLLASVDGVLLAGVDLGLAAATPKNGFVGIGSKAFGARPIFGGLTLHASATVCSAAPREGHKLVEEPCEADSGGQRWSPVAVPAPTQGASAGGGGGGAGGGKAGGGGGGGGGVDGLRSAFGGGALEVVQLQSGFNASLCIACNRSSDPEYRYTNTRAGFVALCNASDARQLFVVEASIEDGPYSSGPITGPDGLSLNIFGNSREDNSDVAFYPWQGSSNTYWVLLDPGIIYSPFYGTCVGACDDVT